MKPMRCLTSKERDGEMSQCILGFLKLKLHLKNSFLGCFSYTLVGEPTPENRQTFSTDDWFFKLESGTSVARAAILRVALSPVHCNSSAA